MTRMNPAETGPVRSAGRRKQLLRLRYDDTCDGKPAPNRMFGAGLFSAGGGWQTQTDIWSVRIEKNGSAKTQRTSSPQERPRPLEETVSPAQRSFLRTICPLEFWMGRFSDCNGPYVRQVHSSGFRRAEARPAPGIQDCWTLSPPACGDGRRWRPGCGPPRPVWQTGWSGGISPSSRRWTARPRFPGWICPAPGA